MVPALLTVVFVVIFGVAALAASAGWNVSESKRRKKLDKRLQRTLQEQEEAEADLLKREVTSEVAAYGRMLERFEFTRTMREHLTQANLSWSVGRLTAMMLAAAFLALNILVRIHRFPIYLIPIIVLMAGFLPYAYVLRKRNKRLGRFEEQFPEALDFLARALRAGHAFSVSLGMIAEEASDPLAMEFRQTFNEQNLGLTTETALANLARRMPLLDVRFFVSAVVLQGRTGGNLGEILNKLAYVIRERFKLKGHVKAVSAHGRLSARIIAVMPFVVVALMMVINPSYMHVLYNHKYGMHLLATASVMQLLGFLIMRKIVDIKV